MITELFNKLINYIEKDLEIDQCVKSGEDFEDYVFRVINKLNDDEFNSLFEVNHNGKHAFPDLTIKDQERLFGLEIKFSASGNWNSKGNSVFESISNKEEEDGYKEIYVLFGRKPRKNEEKEQYEIKIKPYGECIDRIEVTHSPRFSINMNIEENLFKKLEYKDGYSAFRKTTNSLKNEFLRNYFNELTKTKEADKWYVVNNDIFGESANNEEIVIEPVVFKSLNSSEKRKLISEALILFPNDLLIPNARDNAEYANTAKYWIRKYFVYSSNLRDEFTSGGRTNTLNPETIYPKMIGTFSDHQREIFDILREPTEEFEKECHLHWSESGLIIHEELSRGISLEQIYRDIIRKMKPELKLEKLNGNGKSEKVKERVELYGFMRDHE